MADKYENKVAIVTGGSSGIGAAIVRKLLSRGAKVIVASRSAGGKDRITEAVQDLGPEVLDSLATVQMDVSSWEDQVVLFKSVVQLQKRIDYVFVNAGVGERKWIPESIDGEFVKPDLGVLDIDLTGALYSVALAVQQFKRQEAVDGFRGKIINMASVTGFYPVPSLPIYTASKHALVGFTRSYCQVLREDHIGMYAICPNLVRTGISSPEFYNNVEAKGVLTAMDTLLEAVDLILHRGDDDKGTVYECGPKGVRIVDFIGYMDEESEVAIDLLEERGKALHR